MQFPTQWKVTKASVADIADFIRLGEEANLSPWSAQNYVDELKLDNSIVLKLVDSDGIFHGFVVGRVVVGSEGPRRDAEIYNIAVQGTARRTGGGQLLFDSFIDEALRQQTGFVWLEVRESNKEARSFYEKNNFAAVQTRKNFYNNPVENAILMKLDLDHQRRKSSQEEPFGEA